LSVLDNGIAIIVGLCRLYLCGQYLRFIRNYCGELDIFVYRCKDIGCGVKLGGYLVKGLDHKV
jgi:hypothetical protein